MQKRWPSLGDDFSGEILVRAARKLHPRALIRQPVLFLVFAGAIAVTALSLHEAASGLFSLQHLHLALWIWCIVFFSVLLDAFVENRGRSRLEALRRHGDNVMARRIPDFKWDAAGTIPDSETDSANEEERISSAFLSPGDVVVCEADDIIPADGEVIAGVASVDESVITGESAPVVRESGGDRSAVTGGTRVTSNRIFVRVTALCHDGFLNRMISVMEGSSDAPAPTETGLRILVILLSGLAIFSVVGLSLSGGVGMSNLQDGPFPALDGVLLIAALVCLLPLPVAALLVPISTGGFQRLVARNIIPASRMAMEKAADVDVLLLDKSGPITLGHREAVQFLPAIDVDEIYLAEAAQLASLADETPEGRSIVVLAKERFGVRPADVAGCRVIPFSAMTRMSGIDLPLPDGQRQRCLRKGDAAAVKNFVLSAGGRFPHEINVYVEDIAREGGTPLVVAEGDHILGVVFLSDVVTGAMQDRFARLRRMGIRTIMVTGDNATTAAAIAAEAGVDDFMARATPEARLNRIREEQAEGHVVATTGTSVHDAPALAAADTGVAMNTGTQAARHAGNMIDLSSNPTRLIDIVEICKEVLMTRGSLMVFTLAAMAVRLVAIIPAVRIPAGASRWHSLHLTTPTSAILSTLIFNALLIPLLIPVILRGVPFSHSQHMSAFARNLLLWGSGGIVVSVLGIKLIDTLLTFPGWR